MVGFILSAATISAALAQWRNISSNGAKKFGYITGPTDSQANIDRKLGFFSAIEEAGLDQPLILEGNFRYESGYQAIKNLRDIISSSKDLPDAIFCANDLIALGAMDALRQEFQINVPNDVLVGGYDNIAEAGWASYNLTTLVHDGPQMVEKAIEILLKVSQESFQI